MAVNLDTLSISLDRFDAVSDGEFNIGHIKLTEDGKDIVRTNRHKTLEFLNKDTISPEETLAIKDAFCRALSQERLSDKSMDDIVSNTNLMNQMVQAKLPSIPLQNNGRTFSEETRRMHNVSSTKSPVSSPRIAMIRRRSSRTPSSKASTTTRSKAT